MNIQPFRTAPRWWSPLLSPFWIRIWKPVRLRKQHREQRLTHVELRGLDNVRQALDDKHGVLITPNHSGHADAYIMYRAGDQLRTAFYFMSAWQVFQIATPITRLVLRHHGCFSVDRERTDLKAFKFAVDVLREQPHPLVVFPEGEVYHTNDRVTPFREGAAAIALSAAKRAKRDIVAVPAGIKYHYVQDPTPELLEVMDRLENRILWRSRSGNPLRDRIYAFGEALTALKEIEYLGATQPGSLAERVAGLANHVLETLEAKYGKPDKPTTVPERVKNLRQSVIGVLESTETSDDDYALAERDLDDLFFVVQLYSYPGEYVSEQPSIERLAETIDKFEEDVLGAPTANIRATRNAVIEFGEPIPVGNTKPKTSVRELSDTLETRVQSLLDGIVRPNITP
ncbi:MAG: lysophospholipid acyltransferase family protein [Planctomycetota bacterium]